MHYSDLPQAVHAAAESADRQRRGWLAAHSDIRYHVHPLTGREDIAAYSDGFVCKPLQPVRAGANAVTRQLYSLPPLFSGQSGGDRLYPPSLPFNLSIRDERQAAHPRACQPVVCEFISTNIGILNGKPVIGLLFYIQVEGASLADIAAEVGIKKLSIYNHFKGLSAVAGGIMFSFICLTFSMRSLPMGTAYAIWTGIGTVGGALVGMLFFGESKEWRRILFMAMVLAAAIGLKLIS